MTLWTLQSEEVMNLIDTTGIYYPDFRRSHYPATSKDLYIELLDSFNRINEMAVKGLAFCFGAYCTTDSMIELSSKELFDKYISGTGIKGMLSSGEYNLFDGSHTLLKIKVEDSINPIIVNFADYCDLIPPQWFLSSDQLQMVHESIRHGYLIRPIVPCGSFFQYHIPYIKKEDIIERYENYCV